MGQAMKMAAPMAGYGLALLFLSNLFNVADRALLGIVVDPVKVDLGLTDTQMSIVSGAAFLLFNLLVGPFIAGWVDRGNRKRILVMGLILWTAATALTGLARGFYSLALVRVLVGVGEATAFPVAMSMIGDLYASAGRPRAVSIYQASTFLGVVLGSIVAGVLAAAHGWRAMFETCGVAGFALVVLISTTLREPARTGQPDLRNAVTQPERFGVAGEVVRQRGFLVLSLATAFSGMAVGVLPTWAPAFLLRSHGVPLAAVGALIGPAVAIGGSAGTVLSAVLGGRLALRRGSTTYSVLVPMIAVPLAAPFFAIFLLSPSLPLAMLAAGIMNFLLATAPGPCFAAALDICPAHARAMSATLMLLVSGILGGALAPLIVGYASDALASRLAADSLRYGMATMVPTPVMAGALLWLAYRRILGRAIPLN